MAARSELPLGTGLATVSFTRFSGIPVADFDERPSPTEETTASTFGGREEMPAAEDNAGMSVVDSDTAQIPQWRGSILLTLTQSTQALLS